VSEPTKASLSVSVFPNPCSAYFFLETDVRDAQSATCTLFNAQGVPMGAPVVLRSSTTYIPIAHLPAGNYLYRINTNAAPQAGHIIIQR
jgi:hypothetical protein